MREPVVVLGRNYSTTLGIIKSLAESGYDINVFFMSVNEGFINIVRESSHVSKFIGQNNLNKDSVVLRLKELILDDSKKQVVIPTDDLSASIMDEKHEELSQNFLIPHFEAENMSIIKAMDKSFQKELAEEYGFKTAKSWTIHFENGKYKYPKDITYPCFFKPLISIQGGKHGMKKCQTETELQAELEKYEQYGQDDVLVQEYLKIDKEYTISGICFGNQVYLPALQDKLRISEAHKGTTIYGIVESFDKEPLLHEKLVRMLSSLSLYSIIDVEVFKCGERIYFNEINFRTSAVCYGLVAAGANIPGLFVKSMLSGRLSVPETPIRYGTRFFCEKAAWDDYIAGKISRSECRKMEKETECYIISDKSDPKPYSRFLTIARKRYILQHIKKWIRKN